MDNNKVLLCDLPKEHREVLLYVLSKDPCYMQDLITEFGMDKNTLCGSLCHFVECERDDEYRPLTWEVKKEYMIELLLKYG